MKTKLIRKAGFEEFMLQNSRSRSSMNFFMELLRVSDWENPENIKRTFGNRVDFICQGDRVVFDIGGGVYRYICGLSFGRKYVFLYVKFIGSHAAYDKLCRARKNEVGICDVDQFKSKGT